MPADIDLEITKIDRAFVCDLETSDHARAIARAIVTLAQTLGLRLVAEGIESARQEEILRGWGCDEGQGYRYAPAPPAAEFEAWIRARERVAAAEAPA